MAVQLTAQVMQSMATGRVFKDNTNRVNSLDFHRSEDLMATASDDDTLHIYNTASGTKMHLLNSKKHGAQSVCFTHSPDALIYASNKGTDHAVRYLSVHDNRYLRYFRGHTNRVTTVCMSPKTDLFMSASQDRTVRLWDLRTNVCQGLMDVSGQPCAAFDEQGVVFCASTQSGVLKLYDVREYKSGPFDTFTVAKLHNSPQSFGHLKFSNDGKFLLAASEGVVFVLDAYTGEVLLELATGSSAAEGAPLMEPAFSHDGQFVISGCEDRVIRVWALPSGAEVAKWEGHSGLPCCLKVAPQRLLVASACVGVALWIPSQQLVAAAGAR